jgi:hypothetical protein
MPFSYSGDPSSSDKDAVRFEIQDTDSSAPLLQDEEINWTLDDEAGDQLPRTPAGVFSAAARCCEALSRRFAMQADTVVGSLTTTYSRMAENYAERAKELRAKATGLGVPYVGGQSWSEKAASRADPDRVQPRFRRGEFRSLEAGPSSSIPGSGLLDS